MDTKDTKKKETKLKTTPVEIMRKYISAYNKQDVDALAAFVADDFGRFSNSTRRWGPMSKEEWVDMSVRFDAAFPDVKWEVISMIASGDTVAIEVIETGTFKNPWAMPGITIQPTGKSYTSRNSLFFQFNKDGLIQNYRQYTNNSDFLRVGIKPENITKTY
jgi:steroid delta-isomerase-like uncharacterized protein